MFSKCSWFFIQSNMLFPRVAPGAAKGFGIRFFSPRNCWWSGFCIISFRAEVTRRVRLVYHPMNETEAIHFRIVFRNIYGKLSQKLLLTDAQPKNIFWRGWLPFLRKKLCNRERLHRLKNLREWRRTSPFCVSRKLLETPLARSRLQGNFSVIFLAYLSLSPEGGESFIQL